MDYTNTVSEKSKLPKIICVLNNSKNKPENMRVLYTQRIYTVKDYFRGGKILKNKIPKLKGYYFKCYTLNETDLFIIYEQEE
ncbi:MAG: hypothetical protein KatS3mg002_1080 [Candidatus Woesearchaeota archaeon]|nr:MAG: hypothetical protein KatS3mg002_1080 [Candidatus Woesearchaeota archaeon]